MDSGGRWWFGTWGCGASVLHDGGTPFDKGDDTWITFTTADGLADNFLHDIPMYGAAYLWFGLWARLNHIDDFTHHLRFPVEWMKAQRIFICFAPFGYDAPSYAPCNAELFYTWLLLPLRSDCLAKVGQFPLLLAGAIAVYRLARQVPVDDPLHLSDPVARHAEPGKRDLERLGAGDQGCRKPRGCRQAAAGRAGQLVRPAEVT